MNVSKGGVKLETLADIQSFAELVIEGGMARQGDTAPALMLKVQFGLELGLAPLQAIQCIAIQNGRPVIYGDAVPALVFASGLCEEWSEELTQEPDAGVVATWASKRKGVAGVRTIRFTEAMAKKAKLWGKPGPWSDYTSRMLQIRARSWGCRDLYADVLRGLQFAEEVADIPEDRPAPAAKKLPSLAELAPLVEVMDAAVEREPGAEE
jgi:hypothetical protein